MESVFAVFKEIMEILIQDSSKREMFPRFSSLFEIYSRKSILPFFFFQTSLEFCE